MECDRRRTLREMQAVDRLHEVAALVVDLDAAARGRGTRQRLLNEKELVHRIELHGLAALRLTACTGQATDDAGLRCEIVELDAEIDLGGGARDPRVGIDGDAVDVTETETSERRHRAVGEIDRRDLGWAVGAAV